MARRYLRQILLYCAISALIFITVTAGAVWHYREGLPSFEKLEKVDLAETTTIYSSDGVVLRKYWVQRRDPISYGQLSKFAVDALIAAEDQRFWSHWGVSLPDIFRAVVRNLLREGSLKGHGASTITQQLARNLFLTRDQTWGRKFQEQLTAVLLERTYTKREILEMYFNQMLFGGGAWGDPGGSTRIFRERRRCADAGRERVAGGSVEGTVLLLSHQPSEASDRAAQLGPEQDVPRG